MGKNVTRLILLASISFYSIGATAQCTKDTDCKADRVCVDGKCVESTVSPAETPTESPAELSLPPPVPAVDEESETMNEWTAPRAVVLRDVKWYSFYASSAVILAFHNWGGWIQEKGDIEGDFAAGVHVDVNYATKMNVNIGLYFEYRASSATLSNEFNDPDNGDALLAINKGPQTFYGFGPTFRGQAQVGKRVWIGGALDLGVMFWKLLGQDTYYGLELFPRFNCDVLIVNLRGFQIGAYAAFGLLIVPIAAVSGNTDVRAWMISPMLLLGGTFGAA